MPVTLDALVQRSSEVLHQQIRDELVILDLNGEQYYGLNEVGARIWGLLDGDRTLSQVAAIICHEFDAPVEQVQTDLLDLIGALSTAGLVRTLE